MLEGKSEIAHHTRHCKMAVAKRKGKVALACAFNTLIAPVYYCCLHGAKMLPRSVLFLHTSVLTHRMVSYSPVVWDVMQEIRLFSFKGDSILQP